jgi:hypothetical protein
MLISGAAKAAGVNKSTVQFYVRIGLVKAPRSAAYRPDIPECGQLLVTGQSARGRDP